MKRLKLFFACLLMAVLSIGQMWATEEKLATLDFTSNTTWGFPSGSGNGITTATDYSDGTYTINVSATTKYYYNTNGYLMIGKNGSQLKLPAFTWKTTKIVVIGKSGASSDTKQNIYVGTTAVSTQTTGSASTQTYNIASSYQAAGNIYIFQVCSNHNAQVTKIEVYGEAGGTPACATPIFSPEEGAVASGTQVTISCVTDGATIHYTTDGTTPAVSSPTYSSAITVSSAMTIKAIAVKEGLSNSEEATAVYTILEPQTISAIMPTTKDEGDEFLLNDVTVTYAYGSNVYVKDETGYMLVYSAIAGAANGKVLHGLQGKAKLYSGLPEISTVTKAPTVTDGSAVEPEALNAYPVAGDINKYVTMEDVTFASAATLSGSVANVTGSFKGSDLVFRNAFKLSGVSLTAGTPYRVVGIVQKYNDNFQIYPISFEEIVSETQVATPTFSPAAGTYTEVQSVTLSCETSEASIYYTTNGDEPTSASTPYTGAISVGESMTIKAIAVKDGLDDSNVASAAYTINLPLPEHTFQVTHHFSTGEGFEFPTGWGGSYAEHEISYTDDKVHFASASKQSSNITDRPVVKEGPISLILTNSHKLISAVRFDYSQWTTKVPTLTMKYSTDGGENYSDFDPVVFTTDFALQVLTMPEGVNAIQVVGTADKQVGLTSIAFDLEDKPIVTKTVTITAPTNGTLTVMNGEDEVTSGDEIEVNSVLTITATPDDGYILTEVTVNGSAYAESTLTLTENVTIAASFEENVAPDVESYVLSEIGVEIPQSVSGLKVGDKVNLPLTATECSKVFRGWSANASCAVAPEFAPGAEITLAANNKFYAVYADVAGSTWNVATSVEAGDVIVISTNTGYTAHDMKTAGAISGTILGATASTYDSENATITELAEGTLQFTVGGNATDGWTLMNGTKYLAATAAKKVALQDAEATWSIEFTGNVATVTYSTSSYGSLQYNYNSGDDRFTSYASDQVAISLYKQVANYENYSTDCQAAVATPTFAPAAGTYTSVQNVTISCETTGATIHYTTNGDEPTASSTAYSGAIEVGESMTIKAIAVKDGMANSAVATATYTINLPLSTMDQIFAAATAAAGTATDATVVFNNWVVSGVSKNGKNVYVTDGTKGFIIYDNGGEMGFAVGDVLSGTVACKVQLFKGAAELTNLSASTEGLSIETGGVVTPAVKAISALSGINTGAAVTINSVQFDGTNLSDGANSIKPYNSLFAYDALEDGKYYNVTGIYVQYDPDKEILPRSAADIVEKELLSPEISYTPASATIELGEELPSTVFANPHELDISYSSNNEAVATVSNTGVIALGTEIGTAVITAHTDGDATYAAGNATYTITVNPASVSENVVILAVYDTKYYAMSTTNASSAFTAIEVEYDGSKVTVNSEADKTAIQWTKKTSEEKTSFQTKDETPMYMKGTSSGAAMSLNASVCNWSWDGTNEYYYIGSRSFFYQAAGGYFKNFSISDNMGKSGYSDKAQVIVIAPENIVITSKVDPELAYTPASDEITVGDAWSAPNLGYVEGFDGLEAISYESSNEAVATVSDAGVIALAGGTGTAVITASFAGNANYLLGSATYTIKVNEVPDNCDATDDFSTANSSSPTSYTTRTTTAGWSATNAGYKVIDDASYLMINGKTTAVGVITSPVLSDGIASLKFRYANTNNESNGVSVRIDIKQGTEVVKTYTLTKANSEVTKDVVYTEIIENINVAGEFQIIFTNLSPSNNTGNADRVSIGRLCWKNYSAPEPVYTDIRTGLTAGNYYTVCWPKAMTAIKGGSLWSFAGKDASMAYLIQEDAPFEAGKPYIIYATADKLEAVVESEDAAAGSNNGLYGTLSYMDADALAAAGATYMLKSNALRPIGTNNHLDANRAYVILDNITGGKPSNVPAHKVRSMPMHQDQATGVDELNASEAPVKMIIDGQLFILRGEKMYDATGRLVK